MTDINFYSGGRTRKIVAETIQTDHDTKWIKIRILDGYDEVGAINIFGADAVTIQSKDDVAEAA